MSSVFHVDIHATATNTTHIQFTHKESYHGERQRDHQRQKVGVIANRVAAKALQHTVENDEENHKYDGAQEEQPRTGADLSGRMKNTVETEITRRATEQKTENSEKRRFLKRPKQTIKTMRKKYKWNESQRDIMNGQTSSCSSHEQNRRRSSRHLKLMPQKLFFFGL
jgi:hypothetical protein